MSIATKHGDGGQTSLPGGARVAKDDPRVECYGTVDELGSQMGLARALAGDPEINEMTKRIQKELFVVGGAIGAAQGKKPATDVTAEMVQVLDDEVHRLEAMPGILSDWSLPGELVGSAAYDVARTVCRRAERLAVRLHESGGLENVQVLAYLNRLSDLLWLFGRVLEVRAGADASLRPKDQKGPRWSRAW